MKPIKLPPLADRATLLQSPPEVLVDIIMAQQKMIEQLVEEVERLKQRFNSDRAMSSLRWARLYGSTGADPDADRRAIS
jgi:hypothetical protein